MIYKMPGGWRTFLLSAVLPPVWAAGSTDSTPAPMAMTRTVNPDPVQGYAVPSGEKSEVDAVVLSEMDPKNLRQLVDYRTTQPPGTVVFDPHKRFLYLVMENGKALRYGVGVGKAGLEFSGTATIQDKKEWPHWTPTQDMMRREPDRYQPWAQSMDGRAKNPLGARALYLFKDGKDTLYRIHWTTEPSSIKEGCVFRWHPHVESGHDR